MKKGESKNFIVVEYTIYLDHDALSEFVKDPRVKAAAVKTGCSIELTKRVLNKRIEDYKWVRYAIFRLIGPDEIAIRQCNNLLEGKFPIYATRKEYIRRAPVVLYTKPTLDDLTELTDEQRQQINTANVSLSDLFRNGANNAAQFDPNAYMAADDDEPPPKEAPKATPNQNYGKMAQAINKPVAFSRPTPVTTGDRHSEIRDKIISVLASASSDPVVLLIDQAEISVVGSAACSMAPDTDGNLYMNMETAVYRMSIKGDRIPTVNQNANNSNATTKLTQKIVNHLKS